MLLVVPSRSPGDRDGEATRVLRRIRQLTRTTGEGEVSLTPRSEKVIQMACLEARQLDRYYVDTEHLLLGLAREPEGGAARILSDLGVGYEEIRRRIPETRATDG
jgi:ATP-dependent Clp protease ATP-binding subunit ClpA